jgi:hypothetical protein
MTMNGQKQLRTPLIKPRKQGGTFYTFASALEDIGLNINELGNKIVLSHYALLNLPAFSADMLGTSGDYSSQSAEGDWIFAEGFQNYVLNMETVVRNDKLYDFSNSITVSERIFWKWLIKSGFMDMEQDDVSTGSKYYIDKNSVVKCFGYINSGAQRSDDYSMYNETFVQVPSSFGQMKVLFKVTEDDNYYADNTFTATNENGLIEYIDEDMVEGGIIKKTGLSAKAIYDDASTYGVDDATDLLSVEFSLDALRSYYETFYDGDETLTYDDIAIDTSTYGGFQNESFDFNAALIYYSVYDSTGKNILATNAYGLLLFDNALREEQDDGSFMFEPFTKKKATPTSSGTSYSFRLNIKTSSIYNGDIAVTDNSTPAYSMSTDFNDTIKNLNTAIGILRTNANHLAVMESDYKSMKQLSVDLLEKEEELEQAVNELKEGLFRKIDASILHASQIAVGDGISFAEDNSYGLYSIDGSVTALLPALTADDATLQNATIDTANLSSVNIPDAGIDFIYGDDNPCHIGPEGISGTGIFNIQDRTDSAGEIDVDTVNDALNYITSSYEGGNFVINVNTHDAAALSGELLDTLYDQETKKLDIKGLLAILIAKVKSINS